MHSLAKLAKKNRAAEVTPAPVDGEIVGDVSVENLEHIKDLNELDVSSTGHMSSVDELEIDNIDFEKLGDEHIDTESLVADVTADNLEPTAGGEGQKAQVAPPQTLFIKSDTQVNAFLHGMCGETLNMLIHIMAHASEAMHINISYCSPTIGMFETVELVGAIAMTKASVEVDLMTADSPVDLLMLATKAKVNLTDGYRVEPISSYSHGNVSNMAQVIQAEMEYVKYIFSTLEEQKILSADDVSKLVEDDDIIYLDSEDIKGRMKA